MSNDVKISLQRIGITIGAVSALGALIGSWVVLPYRMTAAEQRIDALQAQVREYRELLIRIDENVKALKEARR